MIILRFIICIIFSILGMWFAFSAITGWVPALNMLYLIGMFSSFTIAFFALYWEAICQEENW